MHSHWLAPRRPLRTLGEGLREPRKADNLTNRLRRLTDKFSARRLNPAGYNRSERTNYKKRMPQASDARRRQPGAQPGAKRAAPEKRLGHRLRTR